MRSFPEQIRIDDELYIFERILKEDFFSVNVLYTREGKTRYVLKLSDFRFVFGKLLRPLAILLSHREYRIYQAVKDIEGVPPLGPRYGRRGFFHLYIDGKTLHDIPEAGPLPEDFFLKLRRIIDQIHERRIYYLDLNKRGNIIVGEDSAPYLIDYQVSILFKRRRGLWGRLSDRIFNSLIREDLYHLYKHKKYFQLHLMTEDELLLAQRTWFNTWVNNLLGKPYRKVKRLIYPSGSNEIVWYKWKKLKDQGKRMP